MPAIAISIAGERDRRARRVAEDARQLDQPAERIADEAERSLLRERDGVPDLRRRAAEHLRRRARRHRRGGAGLGLTSALGAGERRALGDHRADQSRASPARRPRVVGDVARCGETGEHGGEHARAAGRRRGDDHAHRRVHLLHGERAARMSRNGVPASGPAGPVRSFAASPPTSPDAEYEVAGHSLLDRAAHDVERAARARARMSSTVRP